jgi:hypothetical protein
MAMFEGPDRNRSSGSRRRSLGSEPVLQRAPGFRSRPERATPASVASAGVGVNAHPKKPDNDGWTKVLARPSRRSSEARGSDTRSEIKIHPEQARRRVRGACSGYYRGERLRKASAIRAKQTACDRDDALSLAQEPEATLAQEPETQSLADSVPSQPGSRTRRTTYWVGDKPVSLVYIPALADEHPETINDERPPHQ